jgi:hypothetical protein
MVLTPQSVESARTEGSLSPGFIALEAICASSAS